MKKLKHKEFLEEILGFPLNYPLQKEDEQLVGYSGLAADSDYASNTDYYKLTTLFNDAKGAIIRVFDNVKMNEFDLFMIGDADKDSRFNIVYSENSYKIYLFDEKGEAHIPKEDQVNPCTDNLYISEPKYIFTLRVNQLSIDELLIKLNLNNAKLYIERIDPDLNLKLTTGQLGNRIFKVIVATIINDHTLHWIFPIRQNRFSFKMPENLGETLFFCFY
ncbi:MAG: hypothetical protein HQ509_05140 [Candidatus Marinimicrobia bacterium]|nr:hypothetical protein [Candidatus Neomarinimicrobiota bacterium]